MTEETRMRQGESNYTVWIQPALDQSGSITVTFGRAGDFLRIASGAHEETVPIPAGLGSRFLHEMAALEPLTIPQPPSKLMIDGIALLCRVRKEGGSNTFQLQSPRPAKEPRQCGFFVALYQLASDVVREPASVHFLEQFWYFGDSRLPVKVFDESPRRIRLFDGLSSDELGELQEFFESIPREEPVLMDLSGFRGMGTVLYPLFVGFQERPGRTVWWVNEYTSWQLSEAGLPPASLFRHWEKALVALRAP